MQPRASHSCFKRLARARISPAVHFRHFRSVSPIDRITPILTVRKGPPTKLPKSPSSIAWLPISTTRVTGPDRPGGGGFQPIGPSAGPSSPWQVNAIQFGYEYAQVPGVHNRANKSDSRDGNPGSTFMGRNPAVTVDTEGRENQSPAFEAWLRNYRTRLEQACCGPNSPCHSPEKSES